MNIHIVLNTFGGEIYNVKITLKEADEDQSSLLVKIINFTKEKNKTTKSREKARKKEIINNVYALLEGRERVLDPFECKTFPIKITRQGL